MHNNIYTLHTVIELPRQNWGAPVRRAVETLLAAWPQAQTTVNGERQPALTVDLKTVILPDALAAVQQLGMTLNPQGLTLIEVDAYTATPEVGCYANGPAQEVARWLIETTMLDRHLSFNGPLVAHLRYLDEQSEVAA